MVDLLVTPEFIKGGAVAVSAVLSVLLYLRFVDRRIMECNHPMTETLAITPSFRVFAAVCIACSSLTCAAMLKIGFAGSVSELLFTALLSLLASLIAGFLVIQVFLTSINMSGDTLTVRSLLGRKQINLASITSISINQRFQFELSDADDTIRFCHYILGKRAFIEHIIERAPVSATWELQSFLDKTTIRKCTTTKLSPL